MHRRTSRTSGPAALPDMFEPSWYTAKLLSLLAEAVAALALVILLLAGRPGHGKHKIGIVHT
jgi:hypothetical protein